MNTNYNQVRSTQRRQEEPRQVQEVAVEIEPIEEVIEKNHNPAELKRQEWKIANAVTVNLRSSAEIQEGNVIGILDASSSFFVSSVVDEEWSEVEMKNGVIGFVMSKFIQTV